MITLVFVEATKLNYGHLGFHVTFVSSVFLTCSPIVTSLLCVKHSGFTTHFLAYERFLDYNGHGQWLLRQQA